MVESYERQTTQSGPISLDTHGAGAICCPAALSSTPVTVLHYVDSALPGNKLPTAGRFQEVLTGPSPEVVSDASQIASDIRDRWHYNRLS